MSNELTFIFILLRHMFPSGYSASFADVIGSEALQIPPKLREHEGMSRVVRCQFFVIVLTYKFQPILLHRYR